MNRWRDVGGFLAWQALCFGVAFWGSASTSTAVKNWYPTLNRPSWNPPDWVFAPVWTTLFFLMGVSAWLVWRRAGWVRGHSFFLAQLLLNGLWSLLFFAQRRPDLAFIDILLLWGLILLTALLFWRHSRLAAWLLMPYLAWVSFAAVLNGTLWSLNR